MAVDVTRPRKRWFALYVLCLGSLMIVLDATIVNVALPSIRADLGFSQESLAWVVNAYLLTFGGFLLLGGRLGDLFGHGQLGALMSGYHFAFVGGAISAAVAVTIGALLLRPVAPPMHGMEEAPPRA